MRTSAQKKKNSECTAKAPLTTFIYCFRLDFINFFCLLSYIVIKDIYLTFSKSNQIQFFLNSDLNLSILGLITIWQYG